MNDVAYMVKDTAYNEELRYSLRSLVNYPHRNVVFFGGAPQGLCPDKGVIINQKGNTKYDRVHNLLRAVVDDPDLSEEFTLFNDDFFVMRPVTKPIPYFYDGDLREMINRVERAWGHQTSYTNRLAVTDEALCHPKNFEVHVPIRMTKTNLRYVLDNYQMNGVRTIYATLFGDDIAPLTDPKWWGDDNHRGSLLTPFLSTDDTSFQKGKIGAYIRAKFNKKGKYEE